MVVRNGKWVCRPDKRARSDKSIHGLKQMIRRDSLKGLAMADLIIKNTYRTLLTRGMRGCLVFSTDRETREFLKEVASIS